MTANQSASKFSLEQAADVRGLAWSASPVTVRVLRNISELRELEQRWGELVADYAHASIFCTWEWLIAWWDNFAGECQPFVLAIFDADSRLVAAAPFSICEERFCGVLRLRCLALMADGSGDSDNLDCPVRSGFEKVVAEAVLDALSEHASEWDLARLNTTPPCSPVVSMLHSTLRTRRWLCFDYSRRCSFVSLPSTWDSYLSRLSSEDQKNLVRYTRRLEKRYSVNIRRCQNQEELLACLEALFRLHQARWRQVGEAGSFSSNQRRRFYEDLGRRLLAKGRLEFWILELNGTIVAAQFAMRYEDTVYQLQEGYDPQHSSDRVGFIMRGEVLRQLISEGIRVYDFLGGSDEYKARWDAQGAYYRDLHFARPIGLGTLALRSVDGAAKLKELLRSHLPPFLWRALHQTNVALSKDSKI